MLQQTPLFANSVEECTDITKLYVLPDGFIYAYLRLTKAIENNEYNPDTAKFNYRLNSSSEEKAQNGCLTTDFIPINYSENEVVIFKGLDSLANNYGSNFTFDFFDSSKNPIGQRAGDRYMTAVDSLALPVTVSLFKPSNTLDGIENTSYVRIRLSINTNTYTINSADCEGLIINFPSKDTIVDGYEWSSTGHAFVPADYEDRIVAIESKNQKQEERISILENNVSEGGTVAVPDFWQDAVNECITKIKTLQVGRNCVTFPFFSDNHERCGYAGVLIAKVMKECGIPYCFFGGDAIGSSYIPDEDTMIAQDKAFDATMSYIPDGRFCRAVGNHDGFWKVSASESHSYTRNQVYELFLREESFAQNKHFGDDGTYYYVNDITSKVRFVVLNTNSETISAGSESIDNTQLLWLQNTALNFSESGWAVVIISHAPIANFYHTNVTNAAEVISVVNSSNVEVIGWFSGHVHRDRMTTYLLTGGNDTTAGAPSIELGFTQVTITSDNTSIAYKNDDGTVSETKHTIGEDDLSHAIDFVTINKATRTVNLTRLGIGNDRSYTY